MIWKGYGGSWRTWASWLAGARCQRRVVGALVAIAVTKGVSGSRSPERRKSDWALLISCQTLNFFRNALPSRH